MANTITQLRGGNQEAAAQSPACGIAAADVRVASAMPARGAAPPRYPWSAPQLDEISSTHTQARRMVREAFEVIVPAYDGQGDLVATLRVSKLEILRALRYAARFNRPPMRMRLTVSGRLPGVLWVRA